MLILMILFIIIMDLIIEIIVIRLLVFGRLLLILVIFMTFFGEWEQWDCEVWVRMKCLCIYYNINV
jgi:hypothetical protein